MNTRLNKVILTILVISLMAMSVVGQKTYTNTPGGNPQYFYHCKAPVEGASAYMSCIIGEDDGAGGMDISTFIGPADGTQVFDASLGYPMYTAPTLVENIPGPEIPFARDIDFVGIGMEEAGDGLDTFNAAYIRPNADGTATVKVIKYNPATNAFTFTTIASVLSGLDITDPENTIMTQPNYDVTDNDLQFFGRRAAGVVVTSIFDITGAEVLAEAVIPGVVADKFAVTETQGTGGAIGFSYYNGDGSTEISFGTVAGAVYTEEGSDATLIYPAVGSQNIQMSMKNTATLNEFFTIFQSRALPGDYGVITYTTSGQVGTTQTTLGSYVLLGPIFFGAQQTDPVGSGTDYIAAVAVRDTVAEDDQIKIFDSTTGMEESTTSLGSVFPATGFGTIGRQTGTTTVDFRFETSGDPCSAITLSGMSTATTIKTLAAKLNACNLDAVSLTIVAPTVSNPNIGDYVTIGGIYGPLAAIKDALFPDETGASPLSPITGQFISSDAIGSATATLFEGNTVTEIAQLQSGPNFNTILGGTFEGEATPQGIFSATWVTTIDPDTLTAFGPNKLQLSGGQNPGYVMFDDNGVTAIIDCAVHAGYTITLKRAGATEIGCADGTYTDLIAISWTKGSQTGDFFALSHMNYDLNLWDSSNTNFFHVTNPKNQPVAAVQYSAPTSTYSGGPLVQVSPDGTTNGVFFDIFDTTNIFIASEDSKTPGGTVSWIAMWSISGSTVNLFAGDLSVGPSSTTPEFSTTTLLLAVLVVGGFLVFVVRRRKN